MLFQVNHPCVIKDDVVKALNGLWRSKLPSKIQILTWRSFLDMLATKDQLSRRGINFGGNILFYILCTCSIESSLHLFLECVFTVNVWKGVDGWLGMKLLRTSICIASFMSFLRQLRKGVGNASGNTFGQQ